MARNDIDRDLAGAGIRRDLLSRLDKAGRHLVGEIRRRNADATGALDRSFDFEVDAREAVLHVGTELFYGRFRELGTRRTPPHAPIRRTLDEEAGTVERILAGH